MKPATSLRQSTMTAGVCDWGGNLSTAQYPVVVRDDDETFLAR
jgi:hypothetical protein